MQYLDRINSINIQIIRTQNSTIPCLKSLKIYGTLVDEKKLKEEDNKQPNEAKQQIPLIIPVEFLDELTNEIMTLPFRLPSGHVIDKSSLDKYLNEQKLTNENIFYSGVDPFTQIKFSSNYKPFIDDQLKAKIDKFLFENKVSKTDILNDDVSMVRKRKLIVDEDDIKISNKNYYTANSQSSENFSKHVKLFDEKNEKTSCMCCLNKPNLNLMYEINSCNHIFCRDCVFKIKNLCIVCKSSFKTSDVVNIRFNNFKT